MVKCALHVISGKAERVSTSDDPTIKIPKPFFPDYKLPIKILSGKTEQSDDLIFVSRMRNAEACITENHHELARVKNQKKASEKGAKWGIFGVFFLVFIIKG